MSGAWADVAERLISDVRGLDSAPLRLARLVEIIKTVEVREAVELLQAIMDRAESRDPTCMELALALLDIERYQSELGYERIADIYTLAARCGYERVQQLVATQNARKKLEYIGVDNEFLERTLGERKMLAATTRERNELDRLLFDRNPQVVERLLTNSRLVERDVVKIAAMRPAPKEVLAVLVASPKWIARYEVKKALISNPYTAVNVALSLLRFMLRGDLKEVSIDTSLAEEVRQAAAARLRDNEPILDS